MKKRILSIILAVAMIVGMIPLSAITVFAEDDTPAALTLRDIIDEVEGSYIYEGVIDNTSMHIEYYFSGTEIFYEFIIDGDTMDRAEKEIIKSTGAQKFETETIIGGVPQYGSGESDENYTMALVLSNNINLSDEKVIVDDPYSDNEYTIPIGSYYWDIWEIYFFDADENGKTRKLFCNDLICEKTEDVTLFPVSCLPMEHGSLNCGRYYAEGATVNILVSPNDGYALKQYSLKATYNDGVEKRLNLTKNQNGTYSFNMPAYDVTLSAEFELLPTEYFYVENIINDSGYVIWKKYGEDITAHLEYSYDGSVWEDVTLDKNIDVGAKERVYFRGDNSSGLTDDGQYISLYSDVLHKVGGDITTLLKETGYVSKLKSGYEFAYLFKDDVNLTAADELILMPKYISQYCYSGMFMGCTILTKAPALPATELKKGCYQEMFSGCTRLQKAPVLPASTFPTSSTDSTGKDCYDNMFDGCTALNCVIVGFNKFDGHSFSPISGVGHFYSSTDGWLNGVADEGTFYVPENFDESYFTEFGRNASSVPEGWTIERMRAVTVSSIKNGIVNTDKEVAATGDMVNITVTPADGYVLKPSSLKATYNNGTEDKELIIVPAQDSTNTYSFTMPAYSVTITAEFVIGTLASAINAISGTYSCTAEWVSDYSHHEISAWITLNSDEFSTEAVKSDGETKIAVKNVCNHSGTRRWSTTRFNIYGEPLYDEEPISTNTNDTIDDFLNTPMAFTLFDIDAPIISGETVSIPAGSFSMDYFAFYDVQDGKTQKMYMEGEHMEFTRIEAGSFTLRELIGKVGGTYNYAETFNNANGKTSVKATVILSENEYCSDTVVVDPDGDVLGSKQCINTEGRTVWDVIDVDGSGKPMYGEPSFEPDFTINDILDYEGVVTRYNTEINTEGIFGPVSVIIPAGSYYFERLNCYFYGMQNGKALNLYTYGAILSRTGDAVHEHTFSTNWSYNELVHWHNATCGHTDIVSGFGSHNFTEKTNGNATTYTCACGYQKVVYNTSGDEEGEIVTGIIYTGISLTLGSDISVNYYMDLTDEARVNGTMTFNIGGRIVTGVTAKYNTTVNKYYFACPITALEMAETVTATFSCNGVDYIQEYSVEEYIEEIVGNKTKYGEKAVMLARKIANYGYYAQIYLASIHDSVVIAGQNADTNNSYAEMVHFTTTDEGNVDINVTDAKTALAKYGIAVSDTDENLTFVGTTVYFDSATALNYYVMAADGNEPTASAVNTVTGKSKNVEIKHYKDKTYIVSVKNIIATDLADNIEVTVNGGLTITGSVLAYCNSVIKAHTGDDTNKTSEQRANDEKAVDAMTAFYEYYAAAIEYTRFELNFFAPNNYKIFTANDEEIKEDTTFICYKPFSFRLVPDENYIIAAVNAEDYLEPDENGLYTVSFVGGTHDVLIYTDVETVGLTVFLTCEKETSVITDTKVSFVYGDNEFVDADVERPGKYQFDDIPKGMSGTIVVNKSGYSEYREAYTADGSKDEITIELIPNEE